MGVPYSTRHMDALTLNVAPGDASLQWPRHILTQTLYNTQQMDALTLDVAPGKDSDGHFPPELHLCGGWATASPKHHPLHKAWTYHTVHNRWVHSPLM